MILKSEKRAGISGFIKPHDLLVLLAVLAAAALITLFRFSIPEQGGKRVYIDTEGKREYFAIDRDKKFEISSEGVTLTVVIKDGSCFVKDSDCADKLCVKRGKISDPGEIAVCLPAKTVVGIEAIGGGSDEADAVAG